MSRDADTVRRAFEVWNESGPAAVIDQFWAEDAVYSFAVVHRLRNGMIVEADYYLDRDTALEAVGLEK